MDPLAYRVARRYLAKTFEGDGVTTQPIEQASFAGGNGGFSITLYERAIQPTRPQDQVSKSYGMLTSMSHFSLQTETDVPLGNANVVRWLREALARIEPLVQAAENSWDRSFVGDADVSFMNGQPVEAPVINMTDMMAEKTP